MQINSLQIKESQYFSTTKLNVFKKNLDTIHFIGYQVEYAISF